ncbi:IclR family transcriptional regulator [Microbacterium sp. CFH 90308]|uniref:IclR family transcriptional regulator n=1 Tax=Microbacterium salsuginis TaxID=2722803 RepID=A0ABX1K9L9_9MICO|nr:IclR family transcriptional regulator [Microbacterium sp. CFH 90308]
MSALTRVLRILDVFTVDTPFLTVSEIARRAGYPISSTHRMVQELAGNRLLEPVERNRYRLGNRLWELGSKTPGSLGLREIAQPFMAELHRRVGQHVQLAVLYGVDGLIVERISAQDAVVNAAVVGGRMPLPHTATGLVLLAHAPDSVVAEVLQVGLHPPSSRAIQSAAELDAALRSTRQHGFAVADGFIYPGSAGLAAPVRGPDGRVVAALGVVIPSDLATRDVLSRAIQQAARAVSRAYIRAYLPPGHPDARPGGPWRYLVNSSVLSMRYLERRPIEQHNSD